MAKSSSVCWRRRSFTALASLLALCLVCSPALTATPMLLLEEEASGLADAPGASPVEPEEGPVGSVIFVRGSQVVAEIPGGAAENEYFVVQGDDFRRKGKARTIRALQGQTYVLQGVGASLDEGDRLLRESEREAAARVLRQNDREAYLAFLQRFPDSEYRPRVGRELFRLRMKAEYPARPGSTIGGVVKLSETVGRNLSRANVQILLDRFVIALSLEGGEYRIDGIPVLDEAVTLDLSIKDPKFQLSEAVTVELPAGSHAEVERNLPVTVVPTVLHGRVMDQDGEPVSGAEVWTSPYTLESLTDEDGSYQIARVKKLAGSGGAVQDEPLFGGEYLVYARHDGYSVERVGLTADSYRVNEVPAIRLLPQDSRREPLPELALHLRSHLRIDPAAMPAVSGPGPMLNR